MEFIKVKYSDQDENVILDAFILSKDRFIEKYMQKCFSVYRLLLSDSFDSINKKYVKESKKIRIITLDKNQFFLLEAIFETTFLDSKTMIGKHLWKDIILSESKMKKDTFFKTLNSLYENNVLENISNELISLTKFGHECFVKTKNKDIEEKELNKIKVPENYLNINLIQEKVFGKKYEKLETKYKFGTTVKVKICEEIVNAIVIKSFIRKSLNKNFEHFLVERVELKYRNKLFYIAAKTLDKYNN